MWNQHLVEKLKSIGFKASEIDECLFYRGNSLYVLYTDDSILTGPDPKELDEILNDMKNAGLDLTVEGDVSDFLGVQIDRISNGQFKLTQPHLINDILKELRLDGDKVAIKKTPGASSVPLLRHMESEDFDGHFDYRRVIGKLNYLEKCTRPDISCAVHQAARFVGNPKVEHGKALSGLDDISQGRKNKASFIHQTTIKVSSSMWMRHSQVIGIRRTRNGTRTRHGHEQATSLCTQDVRSFGRLNC